MFSRIAAVAITLGLVACAELPPPPELGAGGTDGDGSGGAGGGGSCSGVMVAKTPDLEDNDVVVCNMERVYVAFGSVSTDSDKSDVWSMISDGGGYDILLTWDEMEQGLDLNLVLRDSSQRQIGTGTPGGNPAKEEVLTSVELTAGEQFFVEVQAVNTSGVDSLNYNLRVFAN